MKILKYYQMYVIRWPFAPQSTAISRNHSLRVNHDVICTHKYIILCIVKHTNCLFSYLYGIYKHCILGLGGSLEPTLLSARDGHKLYILRLVYRRARACRSQRHYCRPFARSSRKTNSSDVASNQNLCAVGPPTVCHDELFSATTTSPFI